MARFAAVELGQLLDVVWVAWIASVLVTIAFSFVVLFAARSDEARRAGRTGVATGYGTVMVLSFLAFAAVVIVGVQIMLTK